MKKDIPYKKPSTTGIVDGKKEQYATIPQIRVVIIAHYYSFKQILFERRCYICLSIMVRRLAEPQKLLLRNRQVKQQRAKPERLSLTIKQTVIDSSSVVDEEARAMLGLLYY